MSGTVLPELIFVLFLPLIASARRVLLEWFGSVREPIGPVTCASEVRQRDLVTLSLKRENAASSTWFHVGDCCGRDRMISITGRIFGRRYARYYSYQGRLCLISGLPTFLRSFDLWAWSRTVSKDDQQLGRSSTGQACQQRPR